MAPADAALAFETEAEMDGLGILLPERLVRDTLAEHGRHVREVSFRQLHTDRFSDDLVAALCHRLWQEAAGDDPLGALFVGQAVRTMVLALFRAAGERLTATLPQKGARHVREMEQDRRLPAELVTALKSARIYGMLVPRRYGGLGLDPPRAFRAVSALAKLDGSVGWNAMIGSVGSLMPFLATPALCKQVFSDGKDHILAGSGQPVGTAERVPGGWAVSGSWPFASGCQDAEWILGTCVMMESGSPIPAADGPGPMIRSCLMPAECWDIRDTWHTFGLKGTRSSAQPDILAGGRRLGNTHHLHGGAGVHRCARRAGRCR